LPLRREKRAAQKQSGKYMITNPLCVCMQKQLFKKRKGKESSLLAELAVDTSKVSVIIRGAIKASN
jgi:hypothetical protein